MQRLTATRRPRRRRAPLAVLAALSVAVTGALTLPAHADSGRRGPGGQAEAAALQLAGEPLAAGDGWGSAGAGTTGGSAAGADRVFVVKTRAELAAAVSGDEPKIVVVSGKIDANTDDAGKKIECSGYNRDGYSLEGYLQAYDPAVWGRANSPSGPMEDARKVSQQAQSAQITVTVGSNTTLVGARGAEISGALLRLQGVSNVIIRGLVLSDAYDCFPAWDPADGSSGAWNSEYDLISLRESTNVWIDHNDFSDGDNQDSRQPLHFGQPYQAHDGLLDITNASDLVTVSYNRIHDHDKTMLIGSSDSRVTDAGKLRVTVHHNEFRNIGQRAPRVRYGQVDVYNNHYVQDGGTSADYIYSWGVGRESHIVAERNAVTLPADISPGRVIGHWGGTRITENDNRVNGAPADLLAAYNAENDPDLPEVPAFAGSRRTVHPAQAVPRVVARQAGPENTGVRDRVVVAADGSGDATTVQDAVDLAATDAVARTDIVIRRGTYRGPVTVDAAHSRLSFIGGTGNPRDVVISHDNAAGTPKPGGGTWGTSGSASVTVAGAEFEARAVTFENAFDEAAHPEITARQAVAVKTLADRIVFDKVRFLGNQDTLYLDSPSVDVRSRVYVNDSWIQGDVDFIFGRATAVVSRSVINAVRRDDGQPGYVTAPSTYPSNPYGFLITGSRLVSDAGRGTYFLGRPWHPSSAPDNNPRVVIRDSWLDRHVRDDPWATMSGYDWTAGSNAEFRNSGPGAKANDDRPQLTREQAAQHEIATYLAGEDHWAPQS
ncbi:pectinesterase family protein [Parafrankia elaeagni]|uniref:pectinesterase family protein n=1 Tax=Parafrankia elaeagni TaxID=222534 RepID=UPI0003A3C8B5|nr:pectinesterase family protein [Parafrankia elaeagni]